MTRTIQKIGNSYMISIPAQLVQQAGLYNGQMATVELHKNQIVVKPHQVPASRTIATLEPGVITIPGFNFRKALELKKNALYE